MEHLVIVGTSHIAKESVSEVKQVIEKEAPDIVALELDKGRLHHLLDPKKRKSSLRDIRHVGFKGWVFAQLGAWAEKKLGQHVGVSPGQEMLTAFYLAKEKKLPVALVDQDITITLKRFSKTLTWRERFRFLGDIISGVLRRKDFGFDIRTVPSEKIIAKLIGRVKKHYPNVYKVLVVERNEVMARNLAMLLKMNPGKKIVAVVGAGHERELELLVKKYLSKTI